MAAGVISPNQNLALYTVQKRAVQLGTGSGPIPPAPRGAPPPRRPWSGPFIGH